MAVGRRLHVRPHHWACGMARDSGLTMARCCDSRSAGGRCLRSLQPPPSPWEAAAPEEASQALAMACHVLLARPNELGCRALWSQTVPKSHWRAAGQ